jgi:multiple sugar transport system substrate-binding protein
MAHLVTRRRTLALGTGALAALALAGRHSSAAIPTASAEMPKLPIEKGATLRILRPTKFVDADEPIFRENSQKFAQQFGVETRVDFVGWEDLRPQTAVTANTGAGPDIVVGWPEDPHIYADKLHDMSDVAEYLGKKYGGWYFLAEKYGRKWKTNNWIAIPMGGSSGPLVYRESWVKEAGVDKIPNDLDQFLQLCRKLKANGHPVGFALGNAVGDANGYAQWLLWAHGGYMVDEDGKVAINRKETIEALKYAKALYETFIPGTLAWQDPSNNKAFEAGEISLTANGVSIYYSIKKNKPEMAPDVVHAHLPAGVAGKPPEGALLLNAMVFKHTKYPNAAKQYLAFMMEADQYDRWLTGNIGYWAQPLKAYAESDVWKSDPKLAIYKEGCANQFWNGYKGPVNAAAGAVNSDYVLVHMFAAVSSGQATPEDAVKEAERRAKRYYKA